jgi:hypothetical protein
MSKSKQPAAAATIPLWERLLSGPAPTAEQAMVTAEGLEADWRYAELCASHAAGEPRQVFERVHKALYVNAVHPPDPRTRRLSFVCVTCHKPCREYYCTKCHGFVHGPAVAAPGRAPTFEEGVEAELGDLNHADRVFLQAHMEYSTCGNSQPGSGDIFFCRGCVGSPS